MLITTVAISHPPQLLSSSLKGINEQCTNLDSKGFRLNFLVKTIMPQVILHTSKKLWFQRTFLFSTGGESVHIQFVNGQPSSYGSKRESYQGSSTSPRRIWWWEARPINLSIPKKIAQKPLDHVLANDTYIKHTWCCFVPIGFICKWYFHVFSIVMIEENNQIMMVTSKFHMVVLISLV